MQRSVSCNGSPVSRHPVHWYNSLVRSVQTSWCSTSRHLLRTADVSMVVDGLLYLPSVRRLPFGGRDVTEHLRRLLAARDVVIDDPGALQARLGVAAGYHLLLASAIAMFLRKTSGL